MGGYGAFKWALRHPEQFAAAASLSGALDIATAIRTSKEGDPAHQWFSLIFGHKQVAETEDDLVWLLRQHAESLEPTPVLFQCRGTEDFLFQDNLRFKEACEGSKYHLRCDFEPGDHEWGDWDKKIQEVLAWLPLQS